MAATLEPIGIQPVPGAADLNSARQTPFVKEVQTSATVPSGRAMDWMTGGLTIRKSEPRLPSSPWFLFKSAMAPYRFPSLPKVKSVKGLRPFVPSRQANEVRTPLVVILNTVPYVRFVPSFL